MNRMIKSHLTSRNVKKRMISISSSYENFLSLNLSVLGSSQRQGVGLGVYLPIPNNSSALNIRFDLY